jgi:PPOX class probable F420-dependent enzyme
MDLAEGLIHASEHDQGVLVTLKGDGRPQLSNIVYKLEGSVARISVTDDRAKTKNVRRDPRASLYVPGASFWSYLVLEGDVSLTPVAAAPDDPTVDDLVDLYRTIRGEEHPDWDEYRRVMVEEKRLVLRLTVTHAYGMLGR